MSGKKFDARSLSWEMAAWYLALTAVLFSAIVKIAPHFSYSLDDPYIHLALAQNILHGTYGVNPGETVSPSSSIIWPFLLVPFSASPIREWVPLLWNILFALCTCIVLGRFIGPRLKQSGMSRLESIPFALLLIIAANLVGLTFTGMEHCLQILLISLCAIGVISAYEGNRVPLSCLVAAALAPAVRYENLAFTMALCGAIWLQKRRLAALLTFGISFVPIILLGLFLKDHNLAFFPNSVLAKSKVAGAGEGSAATHAALANFLVTLKQNAKYYVLPIQPSRLAITLLLLSLVALMWSNRTSHAAKYLVPAVGAAVAMMLVGPYGWFYRYDVCVRLFLFILVLCLTVSLKPQRLRLWLWVSALIASCGYMPAILRTPFSSIQIARQQYQMHRFASDFAHENVAINDLGWVSFDDRGRFYVLDLVGLGSNETLRISDKDKTAPWLNAITRKHDVGLVMTYPDWITQIPSNWILLGTLKQDKMPFRGFAANDIVNFYATSEASAHRLKPELLQFAQSLPEHVTFRSTE